MNLRPLLNSLVHWNYVFLQKASEFVKESERERSFAIFAPTNPLHFFLVKLVQNFARKFS